jgi:hypothetical protein
MRVNLEIKKPLISILSETMVNHEQDTICLSTDMFLIFKKEKMKNAKKGLYQNYLSTKKNTKKSSSKNNNDNDNDNDKKESNLININISNQDSSNEDKAEIYLLKVDLYDICTYVCSLGDILNSKYAIFPKRKLMNYFECHYENKSILQYAHPNNYVLSFESNINIDTLTIKLSYKDLVLFLKAIEYNINLLDADYEDKVRSFTNFKRKAKKVVNSEKDMNPMEKYSRLGTSNFSTNNNNTYGNFSGSKEINSNIITTQENVLIDKGIGILNFKSKGFQIVK